MKLVITTLVFALLAISGRAARAECDCVAVAAEVAASVQAEVARADNLYANGDYDGALEIYADAYGEAQDSVLLYAQAMASWQLGVTDEAEAKFAAYLEAGGSLRYRAKAEGALDDVRAGVAAGAGAVVGVGGGLVGGVGAGVGAGAGMVGEVSGKAKPKKVAKGAAILLGVVAVVAVGAVAIHGISAGIKDDVDVNGVDQATFDKKFGISLGLTGVVVGATAFYLYGLTAAAGAASAACVGSVKKPALGPVVYADDAGNPKGGGLSAMGSF